MPLIISFIFTPASEASYKSLIMLSSTKEFILNIICPPNPSFAFLISFLIKFSIFFLNPTGAISSFSSLWIWLKPDSILKTAEASAPIYGLHVIIAVSV